MGRYHIINGYRLFKSVENGVEKVVIHLLEDGKFFTQTTLEGNMTEEQLQKLKTYLDETFKENDGIGGGALLTILYYVQNIFQNT